MRFNLGDGKRPQTEPLTCVTFIYSASCYYIKRWMTNNLASRAHLGSWGSWGVTGSGPSLTLCVRVNLPHGCSAVSEDNPTTPAFLSASLEVRNGMEEFPTCPPGFPSHFLLMWCQSHLSLILMFLIMQLNCEAKLSVQYFAFVDTMPPKLCMWWGGGPGRVGSPCSHHMAANIKGQKHTMRSSGQEELVI